MVFNEDDYKIVKFEYKTIFEKMFNAEVTKYYFPPFYLFEEKSPERRIELVKELIEYTLKYKDFDIYPWVPSRRLLRILLDKEEYRIFHKYRGKLGGAYCKYDVKGKCCKKKMYTGDLCEYHKKRLMKIKSKMEIIKLPTVLNNIVVNYIV